MRQEKIMPDEIRKLLDWPVKPNDLTSEQKKSIIAEHVKAIMETLGLDLSDDSLSGTPRRVAKMYVDEIFYGLDPSKAPKIMTVENKMHYNQMLVERDICLKSHCEHHLVTILWKAHVAYIPKERIIGLSKINRIVDFFAHRPQVQERLTEQVHAYLCWVLETDNVAVVIDAEHFCVKVRGIEDEDSSTVTSKLSGAFVSPEVRQEFLAMIKLK